MPELPEVETIARQLAPLIQGRRLRRIEVFDPKLRSAELERAAGRIERVFRAGKQVAIELRQRNTTAWLRVHLRMTGRLIHVAGRGGQQRSPRAVLHLDRGRVLFQDTRRFGTIELFDRLDDVLPRALDPLGSEFTSAALAELLNDSDQQIKQWLLRQDRLVGLGNIYAAEILHAARISPFRPAGSLKPAEVARLHAETARVLNWAVERCGTTFSDFQDARGEQGSFQSCLRAYGREGQPCPNCGRPIERAAQGQRSTFYCSHCQR